MQATSPTTLASRLPTTDLWSLSGGKRLFDLTCALVVVVVASPIMIVLALAVKASSRGPCLFRQKRVGKNGDEFLVLKFRTMHSNDGNNSGPLLTRAGDRRVTSVGKWLRKWKLDELPQIFNVLRGDMSFVGYRPDMLKYLQTLIGHDRNILYFRPGITSPASLKFRNEEQELAKVPAG
jgi:lipopolysaccharide/colanic/teichoic acid biosynthesis glycosyltransferase